MTFAASPGSFRQRQLTGLDGASATATLARSFPQPDDVDDDEEENDEEAENQESEQGSDTALESDEEGIEEPVGRQEELDRQQSSGQSASNQKRESRGAGRSHDKGSFVTAVTKQPRSFREQLAPGKPNKGPKRSSFVTANENPPASAQSIGKTEDTEDVKDQRTSLSVRDRKKSGNQSPTTPGSGPLSTSFENESPTNGRVSSTASLLPHKQSITNPEPSPSIKPNNSSTQTVDKSGAGEMKTIDPVSEDPATTLPVRRNSSGMVRFNLPGELTRIETGTRRAIERVGDKASRRSSWKLREGRTRRPGEAVKVEKMLVQVNMTEEQLPTDYDENESLPVTSRALEKWREFIVVCRESASEESAFTLQMYKTRVIPAKEQPHVSTKPAHEVALNPKATRVNFYSSLDKTLVIWAPWKHGSTIIFILRPRSASSSQEWFTFIRSALGRRRPSTLQVNVPDLSVALQLQNPFGELEASLGVTQTDGPDDVARTAEAETAVARNIIDRSMKMLQENPEFSDVVDHWLLHQKMGLAWKRYDRLEWIYGSNEAKMYGTIAMEQNYELQLRPKEHYPTSVTLGKDESMAEPPPVEGFLIRLTSQRGRVRRLGKMFFKRLYFTTHDQFFCYCRPAKASPPPPPKMVTGDHIPSASQIVEKTPLIFNVDPFAIKDGQIDWLRRGHGTAASRQRHDDDAFKESERQVNSLLEAEGFVDLTTVATIRNAKWGATPADDTVDQGPDVDFHQEVADTSRDDGRTQQWDEGRSFEMVLKNGLVVRLQAYNEETKKEWMSRLEDLVSYWKQRLIDTMNEFKGVRSRNLHQLDIDEEQEARVGQFAKKWEVSRAEASPRLFHMCGISLCRAVTVKKPSQIFSLPLTDLQLAGMLYRKPRRHTTFVRNRVILCHGKVLIFHGTLRERSGKEVPHISHEKSTAIDLKECYLYSGLVTEGDLLYQNQTFDANHPLNHALPRLYVDDGWTSNDEDFATCFVLWHARKKSFFRASEEEGEGKTRQRLRHVSQLGVPGRSIVFKARSRAERDHWVTSIAMEIERLQKGEDVRVVSKP